MSPSCFTSEKMLVFVCAGRRAVCRVYYAFIFDACIHTQIDRHQSICLMYEKDAQDVFVSMPSGLLEQICPYRLCGWCTYVANTCSSYLEIHKTAVTGLAFSKAPCDGVFYMLP